MAEVGMIQQVDINHQLEDAYLSYAMSVIVSRALPDVRDGLKPVHRRILYAMYDMGLHPDRPFKKSARIVGEVLGKYHPHGDVAVYDAMVRMAQEFSMRYLLVDGQGNFGSVDGDSAAAMRYTEARLAPLAMEMLADIQKETVAFSFNFDGTLKEPDVLPAMLPNLLINGADGIAVGMSTKIPPHNIGEICDALDFLIQRWAKRDEIGVEELMRFVQGPDFPTGGIIYRYRDDRGHDGADTIQNAYATGRGRIVVQAKAHVEEMSRNRSRIVVTELPYQTNKANLIERIAELVRDGKIEGITDLRDESDRRGMRVVIELTRTVAPAEILAQLFKLTPLRQTFGVIMLALVDGQPRMLSLKRALQHFVEHRQEVVSRRTAYDLERARARAHILEGLRIALDNLDEVIATIRRSQRVETAKQNLVAKFKLSEMQAQAILDMRLARLAALERKKIEEEYAAVRKEIKYLEGLLADPSRILGVIRDELKGLKQRYNDPRRTLIITDAEYTGEVLAADSLIPDGDVLITISQRGEVQRRVGGGRPRSGGDYRHILTANNRSELLFVSARGRAWKLPVHQLPEKTGQSRGELLGQLLNGYERQEEIAAVVELPADEALAARGYVIAMTRAGRAIRVSAADAGRVSNGTALANVDKKDELLWAGFSAGESQLVLVSKQGQAIRFVEEEIRPTGLGVQGVWAMKLEAKNDAIVGAGLSHEGALLLVASERGMAKLTRLDGYPIQGRYGKGVIAMRLDARSGPLAAAAVLDAKGRATLATTKRGSVEVSAADLPTADRYHQGMALSLPAGQSVVGAMAWGASGVQPRLAPSGTDSASTSPTEELPAEPGAGKRATSGGSTRKAPSRAAAKREPKAPAARKDVGPTQQLSLSMEEPPPDGAKRSNGGRTGRRKAKG